MTEWTAEWTLPPSFLWLSKLHLRVRGPLRVSATAAAALAELAKASLSQRVDWAGGRSATDSQEERLIILTSLHTLVLQSTCMWRVGVKKQQRRVGTLWTDVASSQQTILRYLVFCKIPPTSRCLESHWVCYTHTVLISLVVLPNSSSMIKLFPVFDRNSVGRRRCLCWPEPVESSRRHESLADRTQTPITRRSVWSVSRHVTASGSWVCVR